MNTVVSPFASPNCDKSCHEGSAPGYKSDWG